MEIYEDSQRTTESSGSFDSFRGILSLLAKLEKCLFNFNVSSLKISTLLRLVMLYLEIADTCKSSVSLTRMIKSNIWPTMVDQRFNHLSILKRYSEELMSINLKDITSEFVVKNDSRLHVFEHAKRGYVIFY